MISSTILARLVARGYELLSEYAPRVGIPVEVVDSRTVGMALGMAVQAGVRAAADGVEHWVTAERTPARMWVVWVVGLAGMVVSLGIIGGAFLAPSLSGILSWVTLAGLMLYVASFAVSFGPLLWVMLPEIFPLKVRGAGAGVSALSNWGANFVVSQAFLPLVALIGTTAVFWIFAGVCVAAAIFIYFLVPETRGRSLEQIEADLRRKAVV